MKSLLFYLELHYSPGDHINDISKLVPGDILIAPHDDPPIEVMVVDVRPQSVLVKENKRIGWDRATTFIRYTYVTRKAADPEVVKEAKKLHIKYAL